MSSGIICRQKDCKNYARHRFTWPGSNESFICEEHVYKLKDVAEAMGLSLQVIPLTSEDHQSKEGMRSYDEQKESVTE